MTDGFTYLPTADQELEAQRVYSAQLLQQTPSQPQNQQLSAADMGISNA